MATAAYQVEGGLNGDGEPANNWAPWDRSGRVERCGEALRFWSEPTELLDRAAAMGCTAFRLSVEWARLQPSPRQHETIEPQWDLAACDRYAEIMRLARARGMEPVVTLFHFTHPLWCGPDFWLRTDSPQRFEAYARRCVREIGRRLAEAGEEPLRWWITLNEPAVPPLASYFLKIFPGTGWGVRKVARAYDHALAAHIRAYDAIHEVYEEEGWGAPMVSVNTISMTTVAFDAVAVDTLLARERGVDRAALSGHLRAAASRARRRLASVRRHGPLSAVADLAADRIARVGTLLSSDVAHDALYRSARPRKLDYLSFDYYDPVAGHFFGPARTGDARKLRSRPGFAELWEQITTADGFGVLLRQAHLQAPDRPILVAENGLATPGMHARPDGLTRDRSLREVTAELLRARDEGVNVVGYLHWTIADNYEWGSYTPRFGLHGVDRRDGVRFSDTDATGVDAAGAYAEIIRTDREARGG